MPMRVDLLELLSQSSASTIDFSGLFLRIAPIFGMGWRHLVSEDAEASFLAEAKRSVSARCSDRKNLQILLRIAAEFALDALEIELGYTPTADILSQLGTQFGPYRLRWSGSILSVWKEALGCDRRT